MTSNDSSVSGPKRGRLLVVDDETKLMTALCNTLAEQGYETTGFTKVSEALDALQRQEFDVLITDMQMPEMDGMALLRNAQALDPHLVAIMMTGHATIETAVEAMKLGAFDYVQKPLKLRDLQPVLMRALEVRRLRQENVQLRELMGVHELSAAIGLARDVDAILNKVMDAALQQFGADEVSILLPSTDEKELQVAAARGPRREKLLGHRMAMGTGIAGWVARHKESLILNGPAHDSRFAPVFPNEQIRSAMVVPLVVGGECMGVLNVNTTQPRRLFTPGQLKSLTILSATAAPALQSAALYAQLRAQAAILRESEADLTDFFENAVVGLHWVGSDGRILRVNKAELEMLGYSREEVVGEHISKFHVEKDVINTLLANLADNLEVRNREAQLRCKDGTIKQVLIDSNSRLENGRLKSTRCFTRDITELRQLESQLHQAQKMEAFGQLAGGVAHDFNNLLTIIGGYSNMLLDEELSAEQQRDALEEIRSAGDRAASLTRQLLAFSRKQILKPVVLNLNTLVAETEKMLRRLIGADIDLAKSLDPDLGQVKADPGQMEQVIMNLVVNARDAMPTGGHLTIETQNVELDRVYTQKHPEVQPGDYVMLAVTDSGCGMDEKTRVRIFEPFFTTKQVGKGTGLGLATVHGIVKQSGGSIEVYSEVGRGTSFKIYLPRVRTAVSSIKSAPAPLVEARGKETILLAEDQEEVRAIIRMTLESSGYTVLAARNGDEAVQISQQHPNAIHLLMTDVVMPRMSGRQLAALVTARRPDIKVLYLSGYTDDAIVRHGVLEDGVAFLQKPFTPVVLTGKVRETLDRPASETLPKLGNDATPEPGPSEA